MLRKILVDVAFVLLANEVGWFLFVQVDDYIFHAFRSGIFGWIAVRIVHAAFITVWACDRWMRAAAQAPAQSSPGDWRLAIGDSPLPSWARDIEFRPDCALNDEMDVPVRLTCPITMALMRNPVVARDGMTYDYHSITAWMTQSRWKRPGKAVKSPVTSEPLVDLVLVPNIRARQEIQELYGL